ncbi:MAG: hypothetical protein ACPLRN_02205 [Microgenomates group bacterium]
MNERIIFAKTPNPFSRGQINELPILISSSPIRREMAGFSHLPVNNLHPDVLEEILRTIDKAERRTQEQIINENGIHHSVFPVVRSDCSPITVLELATDKAKAAAEKINKLKSHWRKEWGEPPTSLALVDSAWGVDLTPENPDDLNTEAVIIQKPKDQKGLENIVETLRLASTQGGHLQSVSGICRVEISPDGKLIFQHSLVVVDYGRLNPDFDWQKLANLIADNGHFAGGLSTINLFQDFPDLIIPNSYAKVQMIVSPESINDKTVLPWREFVKNQQIFYLSLDVTNIEQLIAMSVGLVPQ